MKRLKTSVGGWGRIGLAGFAAAGLLGSSVHAADDVFATRVGPVLVARCGACHGEAKQRGGLALHTREAIQSGGDGGAVLVPGKPADSALVKRLRLPLDDGDHMPPEGKPQPTEDEIRAIEAWIAAGAPFGDGTTPAPAAPISVASTPPASQPAAPVEDADPEPGDLPAASATAIDALRAALVSVEAVAQNSHRLRINFAATARTLSDADVAKLIEPVLPQAHTVLLARAGVGDATATLLARAPHLRRLDLRGTKITDASIAALAQAPALRELIIAQTKLTDVSAEALAKYPKLSVVHLWKSGLSAEAIARLRQQKGALRVNAGEPRLSVPHEVEKDLKFTSDAPPPGQPASQPSVAGLLASAAPNNAGAGVAKPVSTEKSPSSAPAGPKSPATLEPINKTCPVSGGPVDPKYTIVYRNRVIGFCCPNCPGQFWKDPAKFEAKLPAAK